jgi:hypothetical protein
MIPSLPWPKRKRAAISIAALFWLAAIMSPDEQLRYCPTLPGKPGALGLSPGNPLGDAPVPMVPGTVVLGAPGWLRPPPMPVVPVPGETVAAPGAAEMPPLPGDGCGATGPSRTLDDPDVPPVAPTPWADAAAVAARSMAALDAMTRRRDLMLDSLC